MKWIKLCVACCTALALGQGIVAGQILGPDGTSPYTFEVDAHGLLSDTGTFGSGTLSLSGAGTEMIWYPGKAAFRAGEAVGTNWNDSNTGTYSAAFGNNTIASGLYSFAAGSTATASNAGSFAYGIQVTASGQVATALGGPALASGSSSFAEGSSVTASGSYSFAAGTLSYATGSSAFSFGFGLTASGQNSVAMGEDNLASGIGSLSMGVGTSAVGTTTAAFNWFTTATAYDSTVFGTFNVGLSSTGASPSTTTWVSTDPLFEIGNGKGMEGGNPNATGPSDALVVYKNGTAKFQGVVTVANGGDIPMYSGN